MSGNSIKVPAGYKQTEAGIIPSDWNAIPLSKLIEFKNGKAHENNINEFGKYLLINSKFISSNGSVVKNTNARFQPVEKKEITMVMSDVPNGRAIAKCFLVDKNNTYTLNQRICSLRAISSVPEYLVLQINRNPYYLSFDDGVKQTNLRKEDVLSLLVKMPPNTEEQKAITQALSDIDSLITKLSQLIQKKRHIKQGVMQELLTGKRRLPGFSGEWEEKRLDELLTYEQPQKYLVSDTEYDDRVGTPVLTAGKTFILGYTSEQSGIFRNLPVIIFDDFTTASKYVDFPFKAKSSAMKMLLPKHSKVSLRFVFEKMNSIDFTLGDHKRYWISEYQNIEISTPTFEEQTAIAQVISDMDAEIETLEKQKAKYIDLKQGMMQQLLTGRIRLAS